MLRIAFLRERLLFCQGRPTGRRGRPSAATRSDYGKPNEKIRTTCIPFIFADRVFVAGAYGRVARARQADTNERDRMDDFADSLAEVQRRRG